MVGKALAISRSSRQHTEHVGLMLEETPSIWLEKVYWFQLAQALCFKNYPDELIFVERVSGEDSRATEEDWAFLSLIVTSVL